MDRRPLTGAIGGKFDPIHDGHLSNLIEASKLCDYLFIFLNDDEIVAKYSQKKFCAVPFNYRKLMLVSLMHYLHIQGEVVKVSTPNGLIAETLKEIQPAMLIKGGDRTHDNMPQEELEVCGFYGIKIIYGKGKLLNSSSKIESLIQKTGIQIFE